ncbi:MAG: hypothetical protein QW304_07755 [Thermoproteota archaeon]
MSLEEASEYEVTNIWVEVGADGSRTIVLEVQGWRNRQRQADTETAQLKTLDSKVQKLVGKRYLKPVQA